MAEEKTTVKVPGPGGNVVEKTGIDVKIKKSEELWSTVELEDGTELRIRPTVVQVIRLDDEYDQDGNPGYITRMGHVIVVAAPSGLRKKG